MFEMIDFHCHPDLYNNNFKLVEDAKINNLKLVAMTNLPGLYKRYDDKFGNEETIRISLGYHPQLVEEYPNEMKVFLNYVKQAKFIGEVGLDILSKKNNSLEQQKEIFARIMSECNKYGKKIISIHSRKADDIIFDFLQKGSCIYIFHWYTGNVNRLLEAMSKDENIYASINLDMVNTVHGRNMIESIPLSRIVLETDAPFTSWTKKIYPKDILIETTMGISKIKNCEFKITMEVILGNSKKIIRGDC